MVKSLSDICLTVIQSSLDKIPNCGDCLPTVYKEMLIERLAWHDQYMTPDYISHISNHLYKDTIRRVNFYKCDFVTDKVLELLGKSGCKLQELMINNCRNVTDIGVLHITKNQDKIIHLKLKKLKGVTNKGLENVCSTYLKILNMTYTSGVTFEGVTKLTQKNNSIQELHICGIDEPGEKPKSAKSLERNEQKHAELIKMASHLKGNLEVLDTQLNQINDDCLVALAQYCPNLKVLNLHGSSRITGEALTKFCMGCTSLESLDLSYCSSLCQAPDSQALWTLPTSLTNLSLCGVLLKDQTIFVECLQRLRNLKTAKLCGVAALNDETLLAVLKHLGKSLTSLDLSASANAGLTNEGIKAIAEYCTNLEVLALSLLRLTCQTLLPLFQDPKRATKIKKLAFSVRDLDEDVTMAIVSSCHSLERLDFSGVQHVTDDLLVTVATNCPNLSCLSVKGCRQVTDRGICELARCCPLKLLVLAGINNLTDKSIFALANTCHYLEEIYLNGCACISPTAVRYLVDCTIPRLFVKHATPNARPNQLMARNLDTGEFCRADTIQFQTLAIAGGS